MIPIRSAALLLRAGVTRRFHTVDTDDAQTVADHSWGVALIFLAIYPGATTAGVAAALTHDCGESVTGDVPAPAKWRNPPLAAALAAEEDAFDNIHGIDYDLTPEEAEHVKLADQLELFHRACRRAARGEREMGIVRERIRAPILKTLNTLRHNHPAHFFYLDCESQT